MPMNARTVDWNLVTTLAREGRLDQVVCSDAADDLVSGDAPWPSESYLQWVAVSDIYEALKDRLDGGVGDSIDIVMSELINAKRALPWDVDADVDPDAAAAFIAPVTIERLLRAFEAIEYLVLDQAYDAWSKTLSQRDTKNFAVWDEDECRIYSSQDFFTGYIKQWHELLRYADERRLGVWIVIS